MPRTRCPAASRPLRGAASPGWSNAGARSVTTPHQREHRQHCGRGPRRRAATGDTSSPRPARYRVRAAPARDGHEIDRSGTSVLLLASGRLAPFRRMRRPLFAVISQPNVCGESEQRVFEHRHLERYTIVRPTFSASIRPVSCSTAKWADMVGFETGKCSESSPADIGRWCSSCSTRRRVGSDSALNTRLTVLCLANHLTIVKRTIPIVDVLDDQNRGPDDLVG